MSFAKIIDLPTSYFHGKNLMANIIFTFENSKRSSDALNFRTLRYLTKFYCQSYVLKSHTTLAVQRHPFARQ